MEGLLAQKKPKNQRKAMEITVAESLAKILCKVRSGFKDYSAVFIVAPPTTLWCRVFPAPPEPAD